MTSLRLPVFLLLVAATASLSGCTLPPASIPTETWRPGEEQSCSPAALRDPGKNGWKARDQLALRAKMDDGNVVVVSALGCRVEVLKHCSLEGEIEEDQSATGTRLSRASGSTLARDLEGACPDATHLVDEATFDEGGKLVDVSLRPLSLAGVDLSGTWQGVARQPGGPYDKYDVRFDLRRSGDVVTGTTEIATMDGDNWGRLRVEGKIDGTTLYFADVELLDEDLDFFLAWCMKGGFAVIDPREQTMKGPWRALACMPGSVELERVGR